MNRRIGWAAVACGLLASIPASRQENQADKALPSATKILKAVRFGKLWDGKGKVWTNAIVIVEGKRVKEVTTDAQRVPAGAQMVDLPEYYGLPGMIDVHTHMTMYTEEAAGVPMLKQIAASPPAMIAVHQPASRSSPCS